MTRSVLATAFILLGSQFGQAQNFRPPPPLSIRLHGDRLERHVERTVKAVLGPWVDDVDVKVDDRRSRVRVEVELTHPAGLAQLRRLLYSMPELAGYHIQVDVDWND